MTEKKETALAQSRTSRDPFALLREMTSQLDRVFDQPFGGAFRWPSFRDGTLPEAAWAPKIDVFERANRLVTKVDLPGLKKEDVRVEVTDGYLSISGERRSETEETKDSVYRSERSFGSFYRAVPLPESATLKKHAESSVAAATKIRVDRFIRVIPTGRRWSSLAQPRRGRRVRPPW